MQMVNGGLDLTVARHQIGALNQVGYSPPPPPPLLVRQCRRLPSLPPTQPAQL